MTTALSVEDMVHLGHDIESTTLARAVKLHAEQRIMLNGYQDGDFMSAQPNTAENYSAFLFSQARPERP